MALLQTSVHLHVYSDIKFPNLLILDEPKQQNLDGDSLINGIKLIKKMNPKDNQVIITTYSENPEDFKFFKDNLCYKMDNSEDYLLKKIN